MNRNLIILGLGVLLAVGIYLLAETRPEEARGNAPAAGMSAVDTAVIASDFDPFADYEARSDGSDSARVRRWTERLLSPDIDTLRAVAIADSLVGLAVERGYGGLLVVGEISRARFLGQASAWQRAGRTAFDIGSMARDDDAAAWFIGQARRAFARGLELDPGDAELSIDLAQCDLQRQETTMDGITRLLQVVEDDPDNVRANLLLARFGLVSGQYEKVLIRTEKVLSLQPANTQALFMAAQAHGGLGSFDEAVELLTRCRDLTDDPAFIEEIDALIQRWSAS